MIKVAAEKGDPEAQHLATMLNPSSPREGRLAFSRVRTQAGRLNDPDMAFHVGLCYLKAIDTLMDVKQAKKWLRRAADQKHPGACYYLSALLKKEGAEGWQALDSHGFQIVPLSSELLNWMSER